MDKERQNLGKETNIHVISKTSRFLWYRKSKWGDTSGMQHGFI